MRKFVPRSLSILATFALVGLGTMPAMTGSAAAMGPTSTAACAGLTSQANNILTPLANATTADNAAQAALKAADAAATADLAAFVTAIVPVIHDLDANITDQAHLKAFSAATDTFVKAFLTASDDRVAAFKTSNDLGLLQLQQSLITQAKAALC